MANSESATKAVSPKGIASSMGFEKEPSQPHGGKGVTKGGKNPIVISHTAMPKRSIKVGKKAY